MVISTLPISPIPVYAATDRASQDAIADHYTPALPIRAGDWYTATKVDGVAWNFFHNAVQTDARRNYRELVNEELPIIYENGKRGRAD